MFVKYIFNINNIFLKQSKLNLNQYDLYMGYFPRELDGDEDPICYPRVKNCRSCAVQCIRMNDIKMNKQKNVYTLSLKNRVSI